MSNATLYYTPTSCGAANFIAAHRAGILGSKLDAYQADMQTHKVLTGTKAGVDFYTINPKGNVPTIILADGTLLNENGATLLIMQYLLQSKFSWIASELQGLVAGLFDPAGKAEARKYLTAKYHLKLQFQRDVELADGRKYYVGSEFTVADSYLYIVLSWSPYINLASSKYPNADVYFKRIGELDFVKEAHAAMVAAKP
ncbi:glutathione-s-transferase [Chytriomyces cf. hyalinus JEL632]|nr:glutathione-s-transferase [Chytriomyces cf. hyalinus JEL632]